MDEDRALSVTEAMTRAKSALEEIRVRVVGEVSEFNDKPGYKAAYFTISDGDASMPCLMWRDAYVASGVSLTCGMLVDVTGHFSAYVPKGRMQFTVRRLELAGEGRLRLQVAELARRLEAEGLMAPSRKRPLPRFPERIALVTSPRGKAVHDVLRTLRRRYPLAEVLLAGVQVEGEGAERAIVEGLALATAARPDVVLLVRGGGSYEDLMPFNAEVVARAVAASPVPVVTGIGHEPDTSIADMVADVRASTPTAAAEAAAPDIADVASTLARERRALGIALTHRLAHDAQRLQRVALRPVFSDPHALLAAAAQSVDLAGMRLVRAIPERLARDVQRVEHVRRRLLVAGTHLLEPVSSRCAVLAARLEDLSPLSILARGWSATFASDGRTVVKSVRQVKPGDAVQVRVSDGVIRCDVVGVENGEGHE